MKDIRRLSEKAGGDRAILVGVMKDCDLPALVIKTVTAIVNIPPVLFI